ncbi:MAG: hypothetical protein QF454_02175 [Candidatus Thalassarchaeaceae archaeon]|nr:hypothetical protein [Candidatus Thalassarchaeaceae archaeon]
MNEDSKKKSGYPGGGWSDFFVICGMALLGLACLTVLLAVMEGLGGSGDATVPDRYPLFSSFCFLGFLAIFIGLLLHKKATPVVLDEEE